MAIEIISTLKPKGIGGFPVAEAKDIDVNGKRLDEQVAETNEALGSYINDVDTLLGDGTGTGGSSGGMSVKSITFTDRPTAFEWLQNNFQKVIKSWISANMGDGIKTITFTSIEHAITTFRFTDLFMITEGSDFRILSYYMVINDTEVKMSMTPHQALLHENGNQVSIYELSTIPDAYWATISAQLTCYYFE